MGGKTLATTGPTSRGHAKITNLREARECTSLPLLGATADWVTSWLRNFVSRLEREYHQHRQAMDKAA